MTGPADPGGVAQALEGVRILDLSRLLPGPACTGYLAGMGAAVDRVEPPGVGDWARHAPPFVDGVGAFFAAVSRGKRSIAVDLRNPEGVAAIRRILPAYDVLVEGFRPGVMEAMGLDPRDLVAAQPSLVVARISGFGQRGPWARRPGHDINFAGLAGHALLGAPVDGGPAPPGILAADVSGALVAAMGIAAALVQRARTGRGAVLDVSLSEAALSLVAPYVTGYTAAGRDPVPGGELLTGQVPVYGTYRCADGRFLTVGALEPRFQARLAEVAGTVDRAGLQATFRTRPRDAWVADLAEACVAPALALSELADHPHWRATGAVRRLGEASWVRPPLGFLDPDATVPGLGEHTDAILAQAGLSPDAIAELRAAGAVA